MAILQTRIFVDSAESNDWAETLIGKLVKPLTTEYQDSLEWFWFSRYVCSIGMQGEDRGDCDFNAIPDAFKRPFLGMTQAAHRSLRFRFEIADEQQNAFEARLRQLTVDHGYAISDFRGYEEVSDTGGQRFLGNESRSPARAQHRARLVTYVYYTASQLLMDMLVGPDANGRYRMEQNDCRDQNPHGSAFESVHHVFCNLTAVPTTILFEGPGVPQQLKGTYWAGPAGARQLANQAGQIFTEVYVRY